MNIAILNYFDDNYKEIGGLSAPNKLAYANRHGYTYICERKKRTGRPASWNKLAMMQRYLREFDWLFWNDADTLITNPERRLETLIDPTYPIITGSDDGGMNCGNILVRGSGNTENLLEQWWDQEEWIDHPLWEQKALSTMRAGSGYWQRQIRILPQRDMNSYPVNHRPGDFLVHFAGYGRDPKVLLNLMQVWSNRQALEG